MKTNIKQRSILFVTIIIFVIAKLISTHVNAYLSNTILNIASLLAGASFIVFIYLGLMLLKFAKQQSKSVLIAICIGALFIETANCFIRGSIEILPIISIIIGIISCFIIYFTNNSNFVKNEKLS